MTDQSREDEIRKLTNKDANLVFILRLLDEARNELEEIQNQDGTYSANRARWEKAEQEVAALRFEVEQDNKLEVAIAELVRERDRAIAEVAALKAQVEKRGIAIVNLEGRLACYAHYSDKEGECDCQQCTEKLLTLVEKENVALKARLAEVEDGRTICLRRLEQLEAKLADAKERMEAAERCAGNWLEQWDGMKADRDRAEAKLASSEKAREEAEARMWMEAADMVQAVVKEFGEPGRVPGRLWADFNERALESKRGGAR